MPSHLNPDYDEQRARIYRNIAAAMQFGMVIQEKRQVQLAKEAHEFATKHGIPLKTKASTLEMMISALVRGRIVELIKRRDDPRLPKALKLDYFTPMRMAVLLTVLDLDASDLEDRFLVAIPDDIHEALEEVLDAQFNTAHQIPAVPEMPFYADDNDGFPPYKLVHKLPEGYFDDEYDEGLRGLWQRVRSWVTGGSSVRA